MGFINDDCIIFIQIRVVLGFGQQDTVCHDLDICIPTGLILKPYFVAHGPPQLLS